MINFLSRIFEAGLDIFWFQVWKVLENLAFRHFGGEEVEHVFDADAHAADARASTALMGIEGDSIRVFHGNQFTTIMEGYSIEQSSHIARDHTVVGCDPSGSGCLGGIFPGVSRCSTPGYLLHALPGMEGKDELGKWRLNSDGGGIFFPGVSRCSPPGYLLHALPGMEGKDGLGKLGLNLDWEGICLISFLEPIGFVAVFLPAGGEIEDGHAQVCEK